MLGVYSVGDEAGADAVFWTMFPTGDLCFTQHKGSFWSGREVKDSGSSMKVLKAELGPARGLSAVGPVLSSGSLSGRGGHLR